MITPSHALDTSRTDPTHLERAEVAIDRLIDEASSFPIIVKLGDLECLGVTSLGLRDCLALAKRYRDAGWTISPSSVGTFRGVFIIDGAASSDDDAAPSDADVH